jgi:hypothetical protein
MKPILAAIFVLFILSSCGRKNAKGYEKVENITLKSLPPPPGNADISSAPGDNSPEKALTDTTKKIIKTGDISFEVGNLNETRKKILISLKKLNGYVAEESETNNSDDNRREFELKLRIPAKNFDLLLDSVSSDADKIDSKNISVKDVTTEYIDVETALSNKKILESTYLGLLKKTDKMSDVLQIESKLTDIRTAIDSTQGELNYLSKQVAYSSLVITFYTKQIQQDNGNGIGYKFKSAIVAGWGLLQDLFFGIISLWPVILLIVLLYILVKRWRKKRRLKIKQ